MKNTIAIFLSVAFAGAMIAASGVVSAAIPDEAALSSKASSLGYPIAELGGCKDKNDCKAFCDSGENMLSCVNYAEKNGLLRGEELRLSKIVAEKVAKKETPGGCSSRSSCEEFCQGKVENIDRCVAFGEELGVLRGEELAEARKIANALRKGAKMPGACKTKNDCEKFCSVPSHIDECLNFAEASEMLSPEKLAEARKVAPFLKKGETPGKCTTKETCDAYCSEDSHMEECLGFAEKAGFISGEEASIARKVGGAGPGGCKGKEECMSYCNMDEHAEECTNFAKAKGLLTDKQREDVDTGIDRLKEGLARIPEEVRGDIIACLENSIGKEKFQRILDKTDLPTEAIGGKIEACFAKVEPLMKEKMMRQGAAGVPSKEAIMKSLPADIPPEVRAQLAEQMQNAKPGEGMAPPAGITPPTGMVPPAGMIPQAGMIPGGEGSIPPPPGGALPVPSGPDCSVFDTVPSCDYLPDMVKSLCQKCKGS